MDCPKCKILKEKLDKTGISYTENNNTDDMREMGITHLPLLAVDGTLLKFTDANDWINEQSRTER